MAKFNAPDMGQSLMYCTSSGPSIHSAIFQSTATVTLHYIISYRLFIALRVFPERALSNVAINNYKVPVRPFNAFHIYQP